MGFDHGIGHLACIPTKKRRNTGGYTRTGQHVVSIFSPNTSCSAWLSAWVAVHSPTG